MPIKWCTEVEIKPFDEKINHASQLIFLGSCFSDNISQRLKKYKFNVFANPIGTIYNPYSIISLLRLFLGNYKLDDADFIYTRNNWYSWLANTEHFEKDLDRMKAKMEQMALDGFHKIKTADYLFITFGTAWVYRYKPTQRIVSNCHKISEKEFTRFRLSVCDITDEYDMLIKSLLEINPKLKIVFTVSPIRHWKDGAAENHLSKSILTVAIHQLVDLHDSAVFYFPAYEVVMDELRDYRFYSPDLLHLTDQTVEYIFEKFSQSFFDRETVEIYSRIRKIHQTLLHEPRNGGDESFLKLYHQVFEEIQTIKKSFPSMDWTGELEKIQRIIHR